MNNIAVNPMSGANIYNLIEDNGAAIRGIAEITNALARLLFYKDPENEAVSGIIPISGSISTPTIKDMVQWQQRDLIALREKLTAIISEVNT